MRYAVPKAVVLTNDLRFAFVDDEDYERVCLYRWYVGTKGYVVAYLGRKDGKALFARLHRFVLGLTSKDPQVDHRSRNKLDNRKENLRFATTTQNTQNRSRLSLRARSGYRNVYWDARRQAWRGCVRLGSKTKTTRYFSDLEEAVHATQQLRLACMSYATE
jgi:hypothetical protein